MTCPTQLAGVGVSVAMHAPGVASFVSCTSQVYKCYASMMVYHSAACRAPMCSGAMQPRVQVLAQVPPAKMIVQPWHLGPLVQRSVDLTLGIPTPIPHH